MRYTELEKERIHDLRVFHLLMEYARWDDPYETEERIYEGEDLVPEAERIYRTNRVTLRSQLHLPVRMISLLIEESTGNQSLLHFFYDEKPERILEWLIGIQEELDTDTFEYLLAPVLEHTALVVLHQSDQSMFELRPPLGKGMPLQRAEIR